MDSYDDAAKYKIEHAGRVSYPVFQTVATFFLGIATLASCGRIGTRLVIRRKLLPDDLIFLFALACLGAATGVLYKFTWTIYVLSVLKFDHTVVPTMKDLYNIMNGQALTYSLSALMWSVIYPIKLCFLVSFKVLIQNVSRSILIWYWTTLALTIIFWGFMIALPFIECPYTGTELLAHCTPETPHPITMFGYWFSFLTDIITDTMVVAIPVYILYKVRIRLSQKLAIASFLCLSIIMGLISLTRLCLSRYKGWADLTMEYLMLYLEACIAVTAGAISAYRAVFVENGRHNESQQQKMLDAQLRHNRLHGGNIYRTPDDTLKGRIRSFGKKHNDSVGSNPAEIRSLPRLPKGVGKLDTLMSGIWNAGRTSPGSPMRSKFDMSMSSVDSGPADSLGFVTRSDVALPPGSGMSRQATVVGDRSLP